MRISARAIIPYNGKYLLVRNQASADFWCLPGGGIEPGEEVRQALSRELIEETGVKPIIGNLLFVHQIETEDGFTPPGLYFHVENGHDFYNTDFAKATHKHELAEIAFINIYNQRNFRPQQITAYLPGIEKHKFNYPTKIIVD